MAEILSGRPIDAANQDFAEIRAALHLLSIGTPVDFEKVSVALMRLRRQAHRQGLALKTEVTPFQPNAAQELYREATAQPWAKIDG